MRIKNRLLFVLFLAWLGPVFSGLADAVTFEAESGSLGADWAVSNATSPAYISIMSNYAGNNPGSAARVATYTVTFPAAGSYELYARVRVGPDTFNDDSFFYANGFGTKTPTTSADWILVNGLGSAGFSGDTDVVTGGGSLGSTVWKWINLSQFAPGPTFAVSTGNLTQNFQIGAREDGLALDKFVFGTAGYTFTVAELDAGGPGTSPAADTSEFPPDIVNGSLIQFNDNGNWTWYSDERAIVDPAGGKIVVGSDGNGAGVGGTARHGTIEAAVFDLESGTSTRYTMLASGILGSDDHNAPAFMLRPDGKYLAQWTGHNQNYLSYFSVFDGTHWSPYTIFDWQTLGATSSEMASYSNPHYLSAENRSYTFVRSLDIKSMNILVSSNYGDTWTYYGKLNRSYSGSGYNPGYYRFCDNGRDRIDFICTESHPRDTLTSIYHGYISNGMSFKTDGTVVDSDLNDTSAPLSSDFMLVFSNGTVMPPGQTNYRCWNSDVQYYPDGTIEAIIHTRINQSNHIGGYPDQEDPNHAFFFCRWNGTNWASTYLCQAGYKLYSAEADYVGLGCLNPNDPNTIFISTQYDPRAVQYGVTDTNPPYSNRHEIWKGVTTNHGASFTWMPITQNSTRDNLRPIVPAWAPNRCALLWWRGTYSTAQIFDTAVVGILQRGFEVPSAMTYVDATGANTTFSDGAALTTTGPGTNAGAADNQWHVRTGIGNGDSVLTSAEVGGEDAPALRTTVTLPAPGTYDLWVNFWGKPGADWRIKAGLATSQMQVLRQMACEQVQDGYHTAALVLTNIAENAYLYQGYVGRVTVASNATVNVFVDDEAIAAGTTTPLVGNTTRTWYDGFSYARVDAADSLRIQSVARSGPAAFTITWNSLPPESLLLPQTFTVQKKDSLSDANWTTLAAGIPSGGTTTTYTDHSAAAGTAFYRITSP